MSSKKSSKYFDGECNYCKKYGHMIVLNVPMQITVHRINHLLVIHLMIGINVMIIQGAKITKTREVIVIAIHLVVVIQISIEVCNISETESNSIETRVVHLNSVSNSVHLLKRSVRVALRSSDQSCQPYLTVAERIHLFVFLAYQVMSEINYKSSTITTIK
jgi:hypothetical protein